MCVTGDQHKSVSPCQEKENGEEDNEVEEDEEDVGDEEEEDREGRIFYAMLSKEVMKRNNNKTCQSI